MIEILLLEWFVFFWIRMVFVLFGIGVFVKIWMVLFMLIELLYLCLVGVLLIIFSEGKGLFRFLWWIVYLFIVEVVKGG